MKANKPKIAETIRNTGELTDIEEELKAAIEDFKSGFKSARGL
jgi:F0F1-type ATP synthase alpha subunit